MRIPEGIKGSPFPYGMMLPGNEYGWCIGTSEDYGYGYTMTLQRLYAYPMFIPHSVVVDRLIIEWVFSGWGIGKAARVGIYEGKNDGTNFPGKLVCEAEITLTAQGKRTADLASPVRLYPGIHWIVIIGNDTSVQLYMSYMGPHFFGSHGIEQYGSGGYPEFINGVYADSVTYGALPSDFPTITGWISNNSLTNPWGWVISFRVKPDPDTVYSGANIPLSFLPASNYYTGELGLVGGGLASGGDSAEIDGIKFSSESNYNPSAALQSGRRNLAAVHSSTKGYWAGGSLSNSNEIDGMDFSTETAINPSATLKTGRRSLAGVHSTTKGYFGGGWTTVAVNEIDGIQFSDETAVDPSATLYNNRYNMGSVNSSTKGYWGGGYDTNYSSEIDGIQFSDETAVNPSTTLATARRNAAGVNYPGTRGYFGGGHSGSVSGEIDGINFSDETQQNPSASLWNYVDGPGGTNSTTRGYFMGGYNAGYQNYVDGLQYSDESSFNTSAYLSVARYYLAGVQTGGIL